MCLWVDIRMDIEIKVEDRETDCFSPKRERYICSSEDFSFVRREQDFSL